MKSILLTRSIEDNHETIRKIEEYQIYSNVLYFNYIHCPLIKYKNLKLNLDFLSNYSNIIITSKYAAQVLKLWQPKLSNLTFNVWVVGNISKNILADNSNFKIMNSAKNIKELIENFPINLYDKTIYLSSNEITRELPSGIKRHIIYNVKYSNTLPSEEYFIKGIDYILLYSQNTAKTLITLLKENNLLHYLQTSIAITISSKVADIVRPFMKNVIYCDDQHHASVINLLLNNAKS